MYTYSRSIASRAKSAMSRAFFGTRVPNVHNAAGVSQWMHEPATAAQKKALQREKKAQSSFLDSSPLPSAQVEQAFAEHHQRMQLERILEFHGVLAHGPKKSLVESLMAWRATL